MSRKQIRALSYSDRITQSDIALSLRDQGIPYRRIGLILGISESKAKYAARAATKRDERYAAEIKADEERQIAMGKAAAEQLARGARVWQGLNDNTSLPSKAVRE